MASFTPYLTARYFFRSKLKARLQIRLPQHSNERLAEAARYALLRRLAPVLRHNMASALQPLGMISTLLEKRLQSSSPDISAAVKNSSQLKTVAREASSSCMGLMTWLAPEANAIVTVSAGVEEATGLIANEFSFNGHTIVNRVGDVQARVPRSLTRNTLLAALIALTDTVTAPVNVVLDAQFVDNAFVLTVSIEPTQGQGESLTSGVPPYRKLEWEDVQALAELESVRLAYTANSVTLRFTLISDAVRS